MGVLTDRYWFVSRSAIATYLCWLCHLPLLNKEGYFICLSIVALLPVTVWVLSLSIPHGMHLVVPTHPYFFWEVCHPSKTFPPKEPEQEPQYRFSPLPTVRPCPLTSNPWPYHVLYWLGTGWWCLDFACTSLLCMFKACLLLIRLPRSGRLVCSFCRSFWLLMVLAVSWSPIFYALLPLGAGFCRIMGFPSFSLLFYFFCSLAIIFCHTTLSFLLWCYLTQSCWAFLGLPFILLPMIEYGHWSFYYITCGLLCPICFFLGIFDPLAFLELPWPFP